MGEGEVRKWYNEEAKRGQPLPSGHKRHSWKTTNDALKGDFFVFLLHLKNLLGNPCIETAGNTRNAMRPPQGNQSCTENVIIMEKMSIHMYFTSRCGALIFPIAILSIIWYNIRVKLVAKTDNNPQTMCKTVIVAELFSLGCEEPVWDYQAYSWRT